MGLNGCHVVIHVMMGLSKNTVSPEWPLQLEKMKNGDKLSSLKRHMFRQTCPELIEFIREIWEIMAQIPSETIS